MKSSLHQTNAVQLLLIAPAALQHLICLPCDCWGSGESIDNHIIRVCDKNEKKDLHTPSMSIGSQVSSKCQILIAEAKVSP